MTRIISGLAFAFTVACGGAAVPVVAPHADDSLEAHVRAHDDEGLRRALVALSSKAEVERLRGLRALCDYEPIKLVAALDAIGDRATHAADANEKTAAVWALVHAGDVRIASTALVLYDSGALARATKLDGSNAFDVVAFARLLAAGNVASEESASRRKVLALAVAQAEKRSRAPLVRALAEDDATDGVTLATVIESLDPRIDFVTMEHVFARLRALADPRAADVLARFADHATHPHFRVAAALRLAELGDLRAASHLAWRLAEDPRKLYDAGDPSTLELRRTDGERLACARMLAELALMHPEARAQLRETVAAPLAAWMHEVPQASGMRLLVAIEAPNAATDLAAWAEPSTPIPTTTSASFPESFAIAQSALRYLGATHAKTAFAILEKELARKPATFDASTISATAMELSTDALAQGGSIAGMVYRALAYGAAEGFSELGDVKAVPLLVKVADDPKANEQARVAACMAAAYVGDARMREGIVAQLRASATDRKRELWRGCWLSGLSQRPNARADAPLVALLAPKVDPESRHQAARLLGEGGLDASEKQKLLELQKDRKLVHDATLAILFGGDDESVAKALGAYDPPAGLADDAPAPPPIEPLRQLYAESVPPLTEDLYDSGALARIALLAMSARNVSVRGAKQDWVVQSLAYQLKQAGEVGSLGLGDAAPHTLTRVRLRAKLAADVKADGPKKNSALALLWLLGERATLASLGANATLAEPSP